MESSIGCLSRLVLVAMAMWQGGCALSKAQQLSKPFAHKTIVMRANAVTELAGGPSLVHVYSESPGAIVFITEKTAVAVSVCNSIGPVLASARLQPARRLTVELRDGESACLRTPGDRTLEVLWHAHRVLPAFPSEHPASAVAARR